MGTKIFILSTRMAFPKLGEPEYFKGQKQRENDQRAWSATAIVAPDTMARRCGADGLPVGEPVNAIKLINDTLLAVAKEKWLDKGPAILKTILPDPKGCCWTDGNLKDLDGYAGNMILAAKRNEGDGRPLVVDNDRSPIYKSDNTLYEGKAGRLFGGCYVNFHVEIWAQQNTSGKGIRAGLLGIQRTKTGDSFGGATAPKADAFGDVADGADADDLM